MVNWAQADRVTATISDITFVNDDTQSQVIEYTHNGQGYEAEFTLKQLSDQSEIDILLNPGQPSDYRLAPSTRAGGLTLLAGIAGLVCLYSTRLANPAVRRKK